MRAGNERPEAQHVSAPSPHDTTTAAPDGGDATHAGHRSRGHDTAGRDEKEDDSSGRRGLIPAANERPGAEDAASAAPCPHASTPPRGGGDVTDVGNGSTGRHVGERGAEDGGGRGGLTPEVKERPEAQHVSDLYPQANAAPGGGDATDSGHRSIFLLLFHGRTAVHRTLV